MPIRAFRVAVLGLVLAFPFVKVDHAAAAVSTAAAPTAGAWDLVGATNHERFVHGHAPVAYLAAIDDVAIRQAQAMAEAQQLFHNDSLAADVGERVAGWTRVSENVGTAESVDAIHAELMASPIHRANILGDFNYIAVAVVERAGRWWAAQVFVRAPDGLDTITRVPATRITPPSNVEASVAASRATFPGGESAAVVIARQDLFADALAGGPLAGSGTRAGPARAEERGAGCNRRRGPARARAHGHALPHGRELGPRRRGRAPRSDALGLRTTRVAGDDRFQTAVRAADLVNPDPSMILLVSGVTFADAMAATPAAVKTRAPLVLADGDDLPATTQSYLERHPRAGRVVIGGPASVGDGAATRAVATERVAGRDRFETSVLVARRWFDDDRTLLLASGATFQDAAVAGAMSSRLAAPLILTSAPTSGATYGFVHDRLVRLHHVHIVGTADEVTPSTITLLLS